MKIRNLALVIVAMLVCVVLFSGCGIVITLDEGGEEASLDQSASEEMTTEASGELDLASGEPGLASAEPDQASGEIQTTENKAVVDEIPELDRMRAICDLAVLKCQYHNVARSEKSAGTGFSHIGETERTFWIEFTGEVEISYDQSKLTMQQDGTTITLSLPEPDITCTVIPDSWTEDSYIIGPDSWNSNPITADDQVGAIADAQRDMVEEVRANSTLVSSAELQVKALIENYITQIGNAAGVEYTVIWEN